MSRSCANTSNARAERKRAINPLIQALLDRFGGSVRVPGFWDEETGVTNFELEEFEAPMEGINLIIQKVYAELGYERGRRFDEVSYMFKRKGCLLSQNGTYSPQAQKLYVTSTAHLARF